MKLSTYVQKHAGELFDWSDTLNGDAARRGWQCLALFSCADDCEPDFLLVKSPYWPSYQVRNITSELPSGSMLTETQIKQWVKANTNPIKNSQPIRGGE